MNGLCAGQSGSSTPISTNHFCMDLALCVRALWCWNKKGPSPNCCHKDGSTESSRMSLYAVALRFPFTELRGLARTMINSPRPLFLLHHLCIGAGSVLLVSRWRSVIHHSRERVSTEMQYYVMCLLWECQLHLYNLPVLVLHVAVPVDIFQGVSSGMSLF